MKLRRIFFVLIFIIGLSLSLQGIAFAETKQDAGPTISIKDNLTANLGKRVSVRLSSGDPIEGTIEKVGEHVVHISKLSGKEYYDAIVRLDAIEALILRTK